MEQDERGEKAIIAQKAKEEGRDEKEGEAIRQQHQPTKFGKQPSISKTTFL